jgi:hypothetical protein
MANNSISFSTLIPFEGPYEGGEREETLRFISQLDEEDNEKLEEGDYEGLNLSGFTYEVLEEGLLIYSDDGDVEAAADFVMKYLQHFNRPPNVGVYIGYAETCSKPRPNNFGGGAVVVTVEGGNWLHCRELLDDVTQDGITVINH